MGGKGETVQYKRMFKRGPGKRLNPKPLTAAQKKILIDKITHIINETVFVEITIETMLRARPKGGGG